MPELVQALARVSEAHRRVRDAERELEERRAELREALVTAHAAGASYALLGRVIGTTRQYVQRIVTER